MQISRNDEEEKWAVLANHNESVRILADFIKIDTVEERMEYLKGDGLKNTVRIAIGRKVVQEALEKLAEEGVDSIDDILDMSIKLKAYVVLLDRVEHDIMELFDYHENTENQQERAEFLEIVQILGGQGFHVGEQIHRN